MKFFPRYFLFILIVSLLADCKSKKPSLSGDEPVEATDFIDFFPAVKKLPWQLSDTSLLKKDQDSLLISYSVFTQFVPDSVLSKTFGNETKPRIYPLAKVVGTETYLFAKTIAGNKRVVFVLGFDKDNAFVAAMPLLQPDAYASTQQTAGIDNKFTIFRNVARKNSDGSISEGKDVYVMNNDARNFMLIMTEALDEKATELINPIDTLPRKQKLAGDYGSGKMNLVSFRDGRKSDRLSFFMHFEKNNGECTGELKGEAVMKTASQAEYREAGQPCSVQFTFTASAVKVTELEGCGSQRGLRCSFDGIYQKKKPAKPKTVKTKNSG